MKYTVLCFQQKKLMQHNISIDEAFLLKVLKDMYSSVTMESIIENNHKYIWVKHSKLQEEVPILGTIRNLKRKLEKLEQKGCIKRLLKHKKGSKGGSYTYIRPTILADKLTDYEIEEDKKNRGDNIVPRGMTYLSPGVGQNCPTKDTMFIDALYTDKQQGKTKPRSKNNKNIVDVVLKNKNITRDNPIYTHTANILSKFHEITKKKPVEKDVICVVDMLTGSTGSNLAHELKARIIIDTISIIQNKSPDKKINSINYFKIPIIEALKVYKPFKINNKLF